MNFNAREDNGTSRARAVMAWHEGGQCDSCKAQICNWRRADSEWQQCEGVQWHKGGWQHNGVQEWGRTSRWCTTAREGQCPPAAAREGQHPTTAAWLWSSCPTPVCRNSQDSCTCPCLKRAPTIIVHSYASGSSMLKCLRKHARLGGKLLSWIIWIFVKDLRAYHEEKQKHWHACFRSRGAVHCASVTLVLKLCCSWVVTTAEGDLAGHGETDKLMMQGKWEPKWEALRWVLDVVHAAGCTWMSDCTFAKSHLSLNPNLCQYIPGLEPEPSLAWPGQRLRARPMFSLGLSPLKPSPILGFWAQPGPVKHYLWVFAKGIEG